MQPTGPGPSSARHPLTALLRAGALYLGTLCLGALTVGLFGSGLYGCSAAVEPRDAGAREDAGSTEMDSGVEEDAGAPVTDAGPPPSEIGPEDRPAAVVVPSAHDGRTELPLFILLHGYGATAAIQDIYFGMSDMAESEGFYLVLPDGTRDLSLNQFWNATPACCDFNASGVDDVSYLRGLVHEMKDRFPIDERRVYFLGHSNGGFMSYRMACEMADEVTAIASLAGSDFLGDDDCVPSQPVSVLQIHGTADTTISYYGLIGGYPSANEDVTRWAGRASCDPEAVTDLPDMDLESGLFGDETTVERWETGCDPGVDAELWSIIGGAHIPSFNSTFSEQLVAWLLRHSR